MEVSHLACRVCLRVGVSRRLFVRAKSSPRCLYRNSNRARTGRTRGRPETGQVIAVGRPASQPWSVRLVLLPSFFPASPGWSLYTGGYCQQIQFKQRTRVELKCKGEKKRAQNERTIIKTFAWRACPWITATPVALLELTMKSARSHRSLRVDGGERFWVVVRS
jgi:hypothetical protein